MRYFVGFLTIVFLLVVCPVSLEAEEMVSVRLVNYIGETDELEIKLKGGYVSLDPTISLKEGVKYTLKVKDSSLWLLGDDIQYKLNNSLLLIPTRYDQNHHVYINDRPYLGSLSFHLEKKKYIRPVNQLPLEDYLKGVVPFEVYPSWNIETLKAQALAARTYAVANMDEQMNDTIQYQVYGGYTWFENTTKAVNQTKGEVITYNNQLIDAFYSASNGGMTESNAHVWGGTPLPYFPIKTDPYDPTHPWSFTLHKTQIELDEINWDDPNVWNELTEKDKEITSSMKTWLNKKGYIGEIKILSIPHFEISDKMYESKRSLEGSITIEFLHKPIDGIIMLEQVSIAKDNLNKIRPMIGGHLFKSYLIDSLDDTEEKFTISGRGYGHGVGMSQWGASIMGEKGKTYKDIIAFYFPGTTILNIENDIKIKSK